MFQFQFFLKEIFHCYKFQELNESEGYILV